jgi:hypothetical protein
VSVLAYRAHEGEPCLHELVLVVNRNPLVEEISNDGDKMVYRFTETIYMKEICPRDPDSRSAD